MSRGNGTGGERVVSDPRRIGRGGPPSGTPGLFDGELPQRAVLSTDPAEDRDPSLALLVLRVRPGLSRRPQARVRLYHVVTNANSEGRCWAFTITRAAWERLQTERVLDSDGATYPDGREVVPADVDPLDVPVRCGTCGTHSVECLQIQFYED